VSFVDHVDYSARRIYLSAATRDTRLDLMAVGQEVRALRAATPDHQRFRPLLVLGGNVAKITGQTATARYIQFLDGCRVVPFNATHRLIVTTDAFTDQGTAKADCFDRTPLTPGVVVDIDFEVDAVEIRYVTTSGSASPTVAQIVAGVEASTVLAKDSTLAIVLAWVKNTFAVSV